MPQTSLRPGWYIPDRIGVKTNHKYGLIASESENDRDLSEDV